MGVNFPNVPVVDNANRADGALGSSWTSPTFSGNVALTIASNKFAPNSSTSSTSYWNVVSPSGHLQAFVTLATNDATGGVEYAVDYCFSSPNSGSENGYRFQTEAGSVSCYRIDARSFTKLGSSITQAKATSDSIGVDLSGGTHTLYYNAAGAGWSALSTRSDSTYTSGITGVFSSASASQRLDDFGTGTVASLVAASKKSRFLHNLVR